MRARTLQRYLQRYVEPRAHTVMQSALSGNLKSYAQAVVVPVYDEPADCLGRVFKRLEATDSLVIAVINAPQNAPPQARAATVQLLDHIAAGTALDVFTVDCVSTPLDANTAVGEARKIGADVALLLHAAGRVHSPWLYQTDADAELPADYFNSIMPELGAVVFGHRHFSPEPLLQQAADLYDRHMAYYTAGLKAAGSAYAYPTLGSTISVHAHSYAAVRGFPKRNAAEDFYLLNKVAKVHGVAFLPQTVIQLAARCSSRVPFGTGPALQDISAALQTDPSGMSYLSYHPASFRLLSDALSRLRQFAAADPDTADAQWLVESSNAAVNLLETLNFARVRRSMAHQRTSPVQRLRTVNEWLDAGKTLRLIHGARRWHPDQPLLKTLSKLPAEISQHLQYRLEGALQT